MILVTGGTGLVGSYLLYELTRKGKQVRALVRDINKTAHVEKLFTCLNPGQDSQSGLIEWIKGDVLDISSVEEAMDGVDEVYHCAAFISFYKGDNERMLKVNSEGTANIVNACLEHGIRKLVHVSSISALGHPEKGNMIDESARWKPSRRNSGYAISKYSSEREVWRGIEEGLNAAIINPSVILGVVCKNLAANRVFLNMKRLMFFYTTGINGFVDVRDVVSSMILLMNSNVTGQRFVITGETMSYREFLSSGAEILHKRKPVIPINRLILEILWRVNYPLSCIFRKNPLFTPETARSLSAESYYSSGKFIKLFNYSFIPVKQSLTENFGLLEKMEK
jgi:dihydroflavonol-4-reductase